jgi:hypothetical protein
MNRVFGDIEKKFGPLPYPTPDTLDYHDNQNEEV